MAKYYVITRKAALKRMRKAPSRGYSSVLPCCLRNWRKPDHTALAGRIIHLSVMTAIIAI